MREALSDNCLSHRLVDPLTFDGGLTLARDGAQAYLGEMSRAAAAKGRAWIDLVLEYGVYLGMDPVEDTDLMWIAAQARRMDLGRASHEWASDAFAWRPQRV